MCLEDGKKPETLKSYKANKKKASRRRKNLDKKRNVESKSKTKTKAERASNDYHWKGIAIALYTRTWQLNAKIG